MYVRCDNCKAIFDKQRIIFYGQQGYCPKCKASSIMTDHSLNRDELMALLGEQIDFSQEDEKKAEQEFDKRCTKININLLDL